MLVEKAALARKKTYSPYSNFPVGAALLCANGEIFTGTNVENACYPCGVCAEIVAYCKAVSESAERPVNVEALALVAEPVGDSKFVSPCGLCRQFMAEFGTDTLIICATISSKDGMKCSVAGTFPLSSLMPHSFSSDNLK